MVRAHRIFSNKNGMVNPHLEQDQIEETYFEFLQSFLGRLLEKFGNKFSRLITTIKRFDTKPGLLLSDTNK